MPIVLNDNDVRRVLAMPEAVSALEHAHGQLARGKASTAERAVLKFSGGWLRVLPAALEESGVVGYKEFHLIATPERPREAAAVRYAVHLYDIVSGELLALIDADYLTQVRTGATAALAAKYLAPPDASCLGVIGTGMEARSQLLAMQAVRDVRSVHVFGRDPARRERFAAQMTELLGVPVTPVATPQAAIEGCHILIVATNTAGAGTALSGAWLPPGLHVSSIGSTSPTQREIDPAVWSQADRIVVDTRRALHESGDCIAALAENAFNEASVQELQDVIETKAPRSAGHSTLFKSVGSGIQDVAVGYRVYQLAKAQGLGVPLNHYQTVKVTVPN